MRILGKAAVAAATLSLSLTPALASPASKLSLRASTASENDSDAAPGAIVGIIGVAAIIAGGVIIATDDDDEPDSN